MLVTTIKAGKDAILIDDKIRIVITRIRGNQVHLGIDAPRDVKIERLDDKPPQSNGHGVQYVGDM